MKISVLCTNTDHPVCPWLERWIERWSSKHQIQLLNKKNDLAGGDILFLISVNEMIGRNLLEKYNKSLVIHASNLPKGRGWSPHIWQILEGKNEIIVTLLEAADKVDSGPIWEQKKLELEGHELADEINNKLFAIEIELMDYAVLNFGKVKPRWQNDEPPSIYRKRTPKDSQLDPNKTIVQQFNLLRVVDNQRFPAFFDLYGYCYEIQIKKRGRSDGR